MHGKIIAISIAAVLLAAATPQPTAPPLGAGSMHNGNNVQVPKPTQPNARPPGGPDGAG